MTVQPIPFRHLRRLRCRFIGAGGVARRLLVAAGLMALATHLPAGATPAARAAEPVLMPFAAGQTVRIMWGYQGGTHVGRERYALDLGLASGTTSGAAVLAPAGGRVTWTSGPPRAGNGCLAIQLSDGSGLSVMLCHVIYDRGFGRGETVVRGQRLGVVGPPGTVGNNGVAHVHLTLSRTQGARTPVPFGPPSGVALDGVSLPANGSGNQHGGRLIVSSNAPATTAGRAR